MVQIRTAGPVTLSRDSFKTVMNGLEGLKNVINLGSMGSNTALPAEQLTSGSLYVSGTFEILLSGFKFLTIGLASCSNDFTITGDELAFRYSTAALNLFGGGLMIAGAILHGSSSPSNNNFELISTLGIGISTLATGVAAVTSGIYDPKPAPRPAQAPQAEQDPPRTPLMQNDRQMLHGINQA